MQRRGYWGRDRVSGHKNVRERTEISTCANGNTVYSEAAVSLCRGSLMYVRICIFLFNKENVLK